MIGSAFALKGRCGTAVSGWMPGTGRGRSVQVVSTAHPSATVNAATCAEAIAVVAGDVVLIAATYEGSAARTYAITSSGGDAVVTDFDSGSVTHGNQLAHIVVTTTGTITITGTISSASTSTSHGLQIQVLRGVDTASIFDVSPSSASHASATSFNVSGFTTVSARALAQCFCSAPGLRTLTGPGGGWSSDTASVTGANTRLLIWREHALPAGTGTIGITADTATTLLSLTWAIRPAAT